MKKPAAKRPAATKARASKRPAADEVEARRIIKEVLAEELSGRKLESVCFHFGDDVACTLIYVNLPLLRGVADAHLEALVKKHPYAGWTEGADRVQRDDSEGESEDFDPYFIELGSESFVRDEDNAYQSVVPYMYRVCAWIERLINDSAHSVKVTSGFRAFVNVHDAYEEIDVDLRRRAAALEVPLDTFLDEAITRS